MGHDAESLFREVADLGGTERQKYYERQGVPAELRAEVESLLEFDGAADGTLTNTVFAVAEEAMRARAGASEGARCGPYVLERLLGRGGMGMVFQARRADGEVEQRVAIKLVRYAADEPAFRERFLKERQILASLSHPGIARLLDAGHTADGQPYLALEYIDGTPIDTYCLGLTVRQKLELFLKVCEAVSYAHRNLVIHRDLKPSNILVEVDGQPKLLDFGIARILDEGGGGLTKERMLTPDFASPEQVRGTARSTGTDVYSLGAVLYRLLTGRSPHAAGSGDADMEAMICSRAAEPPSAVNPALPRDIDFILGKALRQEPEERYATVEAFADDVRAFLESRPVRARSGNAWYHARKFLRRRWLPTAAVAVALAGLSIGLYTANRQRAIAQRRFLQLRQLANKVLQFDEGIRGLPGSTKARQQIVSAGIEYLDGLGDEARSDRALAIEVAKGYVQLAQVQGVPTLANLGQSASAQDSLRKADKFVKSVLVNAPRNAEALEVESEIEQDEMILADSEHRPEDARTYGRRSAASLDALLRSGRASGEQRDRAAATYLNIGQSCMNRHELDDAIRYARQGVELARTPAAPQPYLALGLSLLANALRQAGDLEGALARITEARGIAESLNFPSEMTKALSLYTILWRQGQILGADEGISLGRPEDALEPLERAFELMEQQASKDPNDATSRDREATAAWQLGDVLRHRNPARALAIFDRAVMRQRELQGSARARREEALLLARSSYPLRALHRQREAQRRIDTAFELLAGTKDYPATKVKLGEVTETAMRALGDQQAESGQVKRAIDTYRGLLEKVTASKPNPESDLRQANDLSRIYLSLARLDREAGQMDEASKLDILRLELWRGWDRRLPGNPFVQQQLGTKL